jgi:hypothetical protein
MVCTSKEERKNYGQTRYYYDVTRPIWTRTKLTIHQEPCKHYYHTVETNLSGNGTLY